MKQYSSLSKPLLYDSQLKARLGLAKKRLEIYPLSILQKGKMVYASSVWHMCMYIYVCVSPKYLQREN